MATEEQARNNRQGGIGFCGLLTIVFITLKILGYFPWSWWWVFSPVWIPIAFTLLVLLIIGLVWLLCMLLAWVTGQLK